MANPHNGYIPAMTSNTSPSGFVASASGENSASEAAYMAFNGTDTDWWTSNYPTTYPIWLQIKLDKAIIINSYYLYTRSDTYYDYPIAWYLDGSNDGTNWTVVDTQSLSMSDQWHNVGRTFNLSTVPTVAYQYYRLNITNFARAGTGNQPFADLGAFQIFQLTTQKKYLIKSGGNLYTVVNNSASQITGTLNAALFQQYGVDSIPSAVLTSLPSPSILYWQSSSTEPLAGVYATVTAIPYPQVVVTYEADMSDATIAGIKSITPSLDVTGNGTALFAISFDSGTTYNAYTGTAWQTLDITNTDDFTAKGMTAAILSAITQQQWSDFLTIHTSKKYKIAVLLNRPSIDDNIRIKSIQTMYLNQ